MAVAERAGRERTDVHGMANQGRLAEPMVLDEASNVPGHGRVIMARSMGRFAMVSEVLASSINRDSSWQQGAIQTAPARLTKAKTYRPRSRARTLQGEDPYLAYACTS